MNKAMRDEREVIKQTKYALLVFTQNKDRKLKDKYDSQSIIPTSNQQSP